MQIAAESVIKHVDLDTYLEDREDEAFLSPDELAHGETYVARLVFNRLKIPQPSRFRPESFKIFAADVLVRLDDKKARTRPQILPRMPDVHHFDIQTTPVDLTGEGVADPAGSVLSNEGMIYSRTGSGFWPVTFVKFHDEIGYFPNHTTEETAPLDDDHFALPIPTGPAPELTHV